jgi:hypothetical protein
MRPSTLSEACDRILQGEPPETVVCKFLDTFYVASDA